MNRSSVRFRSAAQEKAQVSDLRFLLSRAGPLRQPDAETAMMARDLSRTSTSWSRVFLLEQGRSQLVELYEGRRGTIPGE